MLLTPPGLRADTGKALAVDVADLAIVPDQPASAEGSALLSDLRTTLESKQRTDRERMQAALNAAELTAIETELHENEQRYVQARRDSWQISQPAALKALITHIDELKKARGLHQLRSVKAGVDAQNLQRGIVVAARVASMLYQFGGGSIEIVRMAGQHIVNDSGVEMGIRAIGGKQVDVTDAGFPMAIVDFQALPGAECPRQIAFRCVPYTMVFAQLFQ